jgi:hypothetical protein
MLFTLLTLIGIANAVAVPRDSGLKIIISNDDGWATANIRTFATTLKSAGYQVSRRVSIRLRVTNNVNTSLDSHLCPCRQQVGIKQSRVPSHTIDHRRRVQHNSCRSTCLWS